MYLPFLLPQVFLRRQFLVVKRVESFHAPWDVLSRAAWAAGHNSVHLHMMYRGQGSCIYLFHNVFLRHSIPLMALNKFKVYKKSGGHVLTHLITGIAKHHRRNELETITHRRICSRISAVGRMHTCYIQGECCLLVILRR